MIETEKRVREAVRYLGFGKNEADERTLELIQQSFKDLEQEAGPKSICQIFDLNHTDDGRLVIGQMEIRSKSLSRNLKGCRQVVLFGATLGAGVDRLMRRISLTDMARAVILQSCAAAMLEEYCDECQKKIAAELEEEHLYLRPRFSPGYGDFSLECQRQLVPALDLGKRIGVTLTDSLLMAPSKSVTAVIGISEIPVNCRIQGCEICQKKDCAYRR